MLKALKYEMENVDLSTDSDREAVMDDIVLKTLQSFFPNIDKTDRDKDLIKFIARNIQHKGTLAKVY
jgi:hypothetical protein